MEGAGTTSEPQAYRFRLRDAGPGLHRFRLQQVDTDGTTSLSEVLEVQVGLDGAYALSDPAPNPVRQQATLELAVRETQTVRAHLYNVLGQRVATLHNGAANPQAPVRLAVEGDRLASGVYFVRVTGEQFSATRRLSVVR